MSSPLYRSLLWAALIPAVLAASCKTSRVNASRERTGDFGNTYQNPVWNHDFPDPNLVRSPDGFFYAYSTDVRWRASGLAGRYTVPVLRSADLVHWTFMGDAFSEKPSWKKDGGGIWAPDVTYYRHHYIMFYSYSKWGDPDPGIGVAVSDSPAGPFKDLGKLFYSQEVGVDNSIDPFLMVDDGRPYLIWGSFHGIYGIPLSGDATKTAGEKFQIADNHFEGSYIYKRGKYYYYFGSSGSCCNGQSSTYHVRVGRALSLKGPYIDEQGRPLLHGGGSLLLRADKEAGGFLGPGHNGDIETDDQGRTWIVYHAFKKMPPSESRGKGSGHGRLLLLDRIDWINGWPVIRDREPSFTPQPAPVFKHK